MAAKALFEKWIYVLLAFLAIIPTHALTLM